MSITDANGTAITDTTHISHINPLRYRGYYYDTETGFYYLQSRYYDPVMHRFINSDSYASTGQGFLGINMFAYCNNNPVNFADPSGEFLSSIIEWLVKMLEIYKTYIELELMGFQNKTFSSAKACYETLKQYGIDTKEEKAHFFAQCAAETNFGMWLTEIGSQDYFSNKEYGYKYRGAGYIQLTWAFNYWDFAVAMGDEQIYIQGAEYVAENYAWQAAGWFWSYTNMNSKIANGATVKDVTRTVRGSSSGWEQRQEYYDVFINIFS